MSSSKMSKMSSSKTQQSNRFSVLQDLDLEEKKEKKEKEDETNEVFQPIFLDASNVLHSESLEVTDSGTGTITITKTNGFFEQWGTNALLNLNILNSDCDRIVITFECKNEDDTENAVMLGLADITVKTLPQIKKHLERERFLYDPSNPTKPFSAYSQAELGQRLKDNKKFLYDHVKAFLYDPIGFDYRGVFYNTSGGNLFGGSDIELFEEPFKGIGRREIIPAVDMKGGDIVKLIYVPGAGNLYFQKDNLVIHTFSHLTSNLVPAMCFHSNSSFNVSVEVVKKV